MYMQVRPDHCKTAQDVRIAAIRVSEFRKKSVDSLVIKISSRELELEAKIAALQVELATAKTVISKLQPPIYPHPIHRIIELVVQCEGISRAEILSERRAKEICAARALVYYLAGTTTSLSLPAIGRQIGGRDHSSVLHGKRKIAQQRLINEGLDAKLKFYEAKLTGF